MDGVKEYVISWLDWGADYVRDDPADFLSKLMMILMPLFMLSGVLAYFLVKQIDKDQKRKERKNNVVMRAKKAKNKQKKS